MIELTCVVPVIWLNSHFCWLQTNLTRKTFSHVVLHSWMLNYWPKLIFVSRMNFAPIVSIDCASICWAQFKLNVFECGWTMKRSKYADLQSRSPKLIWMTVQLDHSPECRCSNVQMFKCWLHRCLDSHFQFSLRSSPVQFFTSCSNVQVFNSFFIQ